MYLTTGMSRGGYTALVATSNFQGDQPAERLTSATIQLVHFSAHLWIYTMWTMKQELS
jgi:hypothetical protein